jgi:hypothetical protein
MAGLKYCKNIAKRACLQAHIVGCMRANGITVACIQYEYTILAAYHHTPLKQESSYIRGCEWTEHALLLSLFTRLP